MTDVSASRREAQRAKLRALVAPRWSTARHVLSDREQQVLALRLGLTSDRPLTQRRIGQRLQLSITTVARLEKLATDKILAAVNCN